MDTTHPNQGLLDLSVELSTRDIMAGNEFTLFVLIKNPFTEPVWVRRVHISLPSELRRAGTRSSKPNFIQNIREFIDKQRNAKTKDQKKLDEKQQQNFEANIENITQELKTANLSIDSQLHQEKQKNSEYLLNIAKQQNKIALLLANIKSLLLGLSLADDHDDIKRFIKYLERLDANILDIDPTIQLRNINILGRVIENIDSNFRDFLGAFVKIELDKENVQLIEKEINKLQVDIETLEKLFLEYTASLNFTEKAANFMKNIEFTLRNLQNILTKRNAVTIDVDGHNISFGDIEANQENVTFKINAHNMDIGNLVLGPTEKSLRKRKTNIEELESSLPTNIALQPSSTVVYSVVLNVRRALLFSPSKYRLQMNVNYSFEPIGINDINNELDFDNDESKQKLSKDILFTNTLAYELSIRASVYSVIIGAALGGVIGGLARILQITPTASIVSITNFFSLENFVSIAIAVILGVMAIIFTARKSDAQSFISVEDFWGAILVGFLVGYTGTSFFQTLTGVTLNGITPPITK